MRFRLHQVALVSDIEKAFLQIGLQQDQRDVTRFLWIIYINRAIVSSDEHLTSNYKDEEKQKECGIPNEEN
jgi:hypothetical protein